MKSFPALAVFIAIFLFAAVPTMTQRPLTEQQREIVNAWNAIGESYSRENTKIDELTKSLRMNPPWRVLDARAPATRAALIDDVIAEHKRRIKLFERVKAEDSKP